MKLIDADALGIGMCNPDVFLGENRLYAEGWNQAIKLLENAPTVDAVEVVRCYVCKYFNPDDQAAEDADWCGWCRYNGCLTDDFDFCSRGIEKDNEDD